MKKYTARLEVDFQVEAAYPDEAALATRVVQHEVLRQLRASGLVFEPVVHARFTSTPAELGLPSESRDVDEGRTPHHHESQRQGAP